MKIQKIFILILCMMPNFTHTMFRALVSRNAIQHSFFNHSFLKQKRFCNTLSKDINSIHSLINHVVCIAAQSRKQENSAASVLEHMRKAGWKLSDCYFGRELALHTAVENDLPRITEQLLLQNKDLVHYRDFSFGFTPLYYAQSLYITDMLIQAGADVNAQCEKGYTPLAVVPHYIVPSLIEAGADIHKESSEQIYVSGYGKVYLTPLRCAVYSSNIKKFTHYSNNRIDFAEYCLLLDIAERVLEEQIEQEEDTESIEAIIDIIHSKIDRVL